MIDELRLYAISAGKLATYLQHSHNIALPLRGNDFGKLLGFWYGEIGAVHTVWNLWEHDSLDSRQEKRAELQRLAGWSNDYLAHSQPLMRDQYVRLLTRVMPIAMPAAPSIYEVRLIRATPGKSAAVAHALCEDMPPSMRRANVGVWTSTVGVANEVVQILAHQDINERMALSLEHPEMQEFMASWGPCMEEVTSSLMLPTPASPLQ